MNGVIAERLWPTAGTGSWIRPVLLAIAGSILVAVSAQIAVPMVPVPMTMQTFAVLLIGLAFGARLGAATLALYAAEAAVGLPVLQGFSGGWSTLFGPTGGYVFGFILAAGAVGWLAERGWSRPAVQIVLAMLIGSAVIYLCGIAWLAQFVGGVIKAIEVGVLPFLLGDAIKAGLAAVCLPIAWRLIGKSG